MLWNTNAVRNNANVANAANEFSGNNAPQKRTVEQLPPLLAHPRHPGGREKAEETQGGSSIDIFDFVQFLGGHFWAFF